jgi:hypothetical protein
MPQTNDTTQLLQYQLFLCTDSFITRLDYTTAKEMWKVCIRNNYNFIEWKEFYTEQDAEEYAQSHLRRYTHWICFSSDTKQEIFRS